MKNIYTGINTEIVNQVRYATRRALQLLNRHMEIEDIEQEFMMEIFQALKKYDSERSTLSTYTARVLKYKTICMFNEMRAKKRYIQCSELVDNSVSVDSSISDCLKLDLEKFKKLLPKKLKLLLVQLDKFNIREISTTYKIPQSTLRSRMHKLKKALRKNGFHCY